MNYGNFSTRAENRVLGKRILKTGSELYVEFTMQPPSEFFLETDAKSTRTVTIGMENFFVKFGFSFWESTRAQDDL